MSVYAERPGDGHHPLHRRLTAGRAQNNSTIATLAHCHLRLARQDCDRSCQSQPHSARYVTSGFDCPCLSTLRSCRRSRRRCWCPSARTAGCTCGPAAWQAWTWTRTNRSRYERPHGDRAEPRYHSVSLRVSVDKWWSGRLGPNHCFATICLVLASQLISAPDDTPSYVMDVSHR